YWSATTGGAKGGTITRAYDGGNPVPYILSSPPVVDDLVCSRPYKVGRDDLLIANLLPQVMAWSTSITQQPTDPNYKPGGTPIVWTGLLSKVQGPDTDANTEGAAMVVVTFTIASAS